MQSIYDKFFYPTKSGSLKNARAPEVLPISKASIGLGLVNGFGTIGYSLITPFYGGLVDSTGGYFYSNMVIITISIILTATMILFTKETYGGVNNTN